MKASQIESTYPLSPTQEGMLFHTLSAPGTGVYVAQIMARLPNTLDRTAFVRAWQQVMARHAVLRTSFEWNGVPAPVQRVHRVCPCRVVRRDWRGLDSARQRELLDSDRRRGFDLRVAPLVRLALCDAPGGEVLFVLTHHQILLDGRARVILLKEVAQLYDASVNGRTLELPPRPPYRHYIEWLCGRTLPGAEEYWRQSLGAIQPQPWLTPRVHDAGQPRAWQWGARSVNIPADVGHALQRLAQAQRVTSNIVVQGAWALLVSRYSGERDVVFGVTRSCRRPGFEGVTSLVGVVMNTLPCAVRIDPQQPFSDLLQQLRKQHAAMRHFETTPLLKARGWAGLSTNGALFDSTVVFDERDLGHTLLGADGPGLWPENIRRSVHTHYPLTLTGYDKPLLSLEIDYRRDVIDDTHVRRLMSHLESVLQRIAADPHARCGDLRLVGPSERDELLHASTGPLRIVPAITIPDLVERQAAQHPDRTAVVCEDTHVTYGDLNARANRLAGVLAARGIGPESLVAVAMPRLPELIVALLGVMKAGGAYLPLDPDSPPERLALILDDARPACMVTTRDAARVLPPSAHVVLDEPRWTAAMARQPSHDLDDTTRVRPLTPQNVAYVMYTSGSTGIPKGVVVPHAALVNKIHTLNDYLGVTSATLFAATTAIHFDPSLDQIFCPLCAGGTTVVVPDHVRNDPSRFAAYAARHRLSIVNAPPSLVERLFSRASPRLDALIIGAETLRGALANDLRAQGAARRMFNFYGPTETCINASAYEIEAELPPGSVPIGSALPNYRLYVLDANLHLVPPEVRGELYIAGAGLARAYLNRPALTAKRFVPDPFGSAGDRMYRTGDIVQRRADQQLEFLGRADRQVKIRGVRIEPDEIETTLQQHPDVQRAVVVAKEQPSGEKRLIAYVVWADGVCRPIDELRAFLASRLPRSMIPSSFVAIDAIPLTSSGKLDYAALPAVGETAARPALGAAPPRTAVETMLAGIWGEVLDVECVGLHDDFFELGGHSLSAMQVISRLRDRLHLDVPIQTLFSAVTIEALARSIEDLTRKEQPP